MKHHDQGNLWKGLFDFWFQEDKLESEHAINWKAWWQEKGLEAGSLHINHEHEGKRDEVGRSFSSQSLALVTYFLQQGCIT